MRVVSLFFSFVDLTIHSVQAMLTNRATYGGCSNGFARSYVLVVIGVGLNPSPKTTDELAKDTIFAKDRVQFSEVFNTHIFVEPARLMIPQFPSTSRGARHCQLAVGILMVRFLHGERVGPLASRITWGSAHSFCRWPPLVASQRAVETDGT